MSIQIWTYVLVGLSFGLYIYIAIRSKATSTGEFYVAGKIRRPFGHVVGRFGARKKRLVIRVFFPVVP